MTGFKAGEMNVIMGQCNLKSSLLCWEDLNRRRRLQTLSYRLDWHDKEIYIVVTYWPHHKHYQRKSFSFKDLNQHENGWRFALAQELRAMRKAKPDVGTLFSKRH